MLPSFEGGNRTRKVGTVQTKQYMETLRYGDRDDAFANTLLHSTQQDGR